MKKLLSSGEVCEITGLPQNTLDRWCSGESVDLEGPVVTPYQEAKRPVVKPYQEASGRGTQRRFTVAQAVGLAFAAEWREWGAGWPLLEPLLRELMKLTEKQMLAAFAEGRTHILELPGNRLEKAPPGNFPSAERLNLRRVYCKVQERIAELEERERSRPPKPGRKRALHPKRRAKR